jgi:hypothetical protein
VSQSTIEQRYGKSRIRGRDRIWAIAIAASALIAFLIWAVLFAIDDANSPKTQDLSYQIIDETLAEVTFEVNRPLGQVLECDVQVLNQSYSVVGFKRVLIEAENVRKRVVSTSVNTTELGVTGLVDTCRVK